MNGINPPDRPVIAGSSFRTERQTGNTGFSTGASFEELLKQRISVQQQEQPLIFSKHAQARTEQRGITVSQDDMRRLDDAIAQAKDKGLTDTLVLMNDTAFIVNVPNKVVVTVVDSAETKSTVFTNIDGAVII